MSSAGLSSDTAAEWLFGWDETTGIVSVHAEAEGRAIVWRRDTATGLLQRDEERFRPWALVDDVAHLGTSPLPRGAELDVRELEGPGALRFHVSAGDQRTLNAALVAAASRRFGRDVERIDQLDDATVLALPLEEQYLVATGRTYFRDLPFEALHRLQFDLETTGLDPARDRIFLIAVRHHDGRTEVLEARGDDTRAEAGLIEALMDVVRGADPDVIENHNLHGFDLPFLETRAQRAGVRLALGRVSGAPLRRRTARRGAPMPGQEGRRMRFVAPGRELVDTLDFVRRHDHTARDLPGHGLKAVARHLGFAAPDREYIPGHLVYTTYRADPARVTRYATDDVEEVAELSRRLGGPAFALAQMVPRRYERLTDAGAATGVLDPLLVRAYLRAGAALPAHEPGDGTVHTGAALHLFATGVAQRVVKADVASLYPSLMRSYRIGPARDRLGALLTMVDALVERRLAAKAAARAAPIGSAERHAHEAMSGALKGIVNSAYGYLAAGGSLTRFADVHAANEVTRRGREVLALLCSALAERGVTLLEADTDGVYFAVPEHWSESEERRAVSEVARLLPPLVQLELEGRYRAMLSHEPKNYALLGYDGTLTLRGVAFRSSRSEPYGEHFLKRALGHLLAGDIVAVRDVYLATIGALRTRALATAEVSQRVRLTKSPEEYETTRATRRELPYEAMLANGRPRWALGERVRVYRRQGGAAGLIDEDVEERGAEDARDYDVAYYERLLRTTYAERLARAFTAEDFATVFADPDQYPLFGGSLGAVRTVLTVQETSPIDGA